jgi:Ser/Thr protein kinase RdoA (MazF antagonist)
LDNLAAVAEQFKLPGRVIDVREFGNGNINNTFLVTLDSKEEKHFILQRINTQVFRQPGLVIQNMLTFTGHVSKRLNDTPPGEGRSWKVPRVLMTQDGEDHWCDTDGSFWRAISFIEGAQTFDTIKNIENAREVGYALGMFHTLISDLPPDRMVDTLAGFHITPLYLQHYHEVIEKHSISRYSEVNYCVQFIRERNVWAQVLENAKARGILQLRPIHGDPKVNNIMIDNNTGRAVSIIDLDTVKPGLVHYDIGDLLRSGCNPLGEETGQWEMICFDLDYCRAILQGYCSIAQEFLTENDYDYLYDSIRLLAFELGLRFFTDYLEGNVYFKVGRSDHNLARALVQFKLTESIESRETAIRAIIRDMR